MSDFPTEDGGSGGKPDELIGQTVSKFRVLSRLGQGGMGVVYKALDTSLDREVALKFLPPSFQADEEAEARFVHEAKAASALDHPNISVIHEVGRSDRGQLYIAMACYAGETLEDKIEQGPLTIDDALEYSIQIARGLDRAHEEGIIHRDIKPGNVIVTERGLAKVLDFGLAKMQDVTLTRDGASLGTLAYMSPEQARGGDIDNRTDLWALGVVLYEMLAGRRPFAGSYEAAVLYAAANTDHDPVTMYRPEVPEAVSVVVDALLEKDPDRRYQTAHDAVAALEAARVGTAHPGATVSGIMPPQPEAVGAVEATSAESVAVTTEAEAVSTTQAQAVIAAGSALWTKWAGIAAVGILAVLSSLWALGTFDGESTSVSAEQQAQARTMHEEGLSFLQDGNTSLGQARLERAVLLDPDYSAAWSSLAALHTSRRDYLQAVEAGERAVALDSLNETAQYNLGFALQETGYPEQASEAYRTAIRANRTMTEAYSALGDVLIELDRPADAIRILAEGMRATPESDYIFLLKKNTGKALLDLGDAAAALDHLDESLAIQPRWPETLMLAARAQHSLGDVEASASLWDRYFQVETDPVRRTQAETLRSAQGGQDPADGQ